MAEAVAQFRAAHQIHDAEPRVLADPLALTLLGPEAVAKIESSRKLHLSWYMKRGRTIAIVRSRYTEDQLAEMIAQGVRQYVILGAGLDTSPYRPGHPGEIAFQSRRHWRRGIQSRRSSRRSSKPCNG